MTREFPKSEEQNVTSQIRRAAVSIPLNIAEGSAKASEREFAYFLDELNAKLFLFLRNIEMRVGSKRYHFFQKFEEKEIET